MRLTESQLRQIVEEEWDALVSEAGERRIIRPGEARPPAPPIQSPSPVASMSPARPKDISDIQATRSKMVSGSPFEAGSDAFNTLYNGGNAEEFIRFKVKSKVTNDEFLMGRLVSNTFNAGTYVCVPGLFENKLGVGRIVEITNRPLIDNPNAIAPLAIVEFQAGQHGGWGSFPPDSVLRINHVGIAYLMKISSGNADEEARKFRARASAAKAAPVKPSMGGMKTVKYRAGN